MSWMATLYETYEKGLTLDQSSRPFEERLMPVSHTLQNAHINIVLDESGNFRRAAVLDKTQIILPATEESAGRTSGEAPHPLADKIQYVAKDYAEYGGEKKPYFASYEKQLAEWCASPFAHKKACAVHSYISKGRVIADLIEHRILHCDENGQLLTKWPFEITAERPEPAIFKVLPKKEGRIEPGDALVCWSVEDKEEAGKKGSKTWKDQSLQQSWIDFNASSEGGIGLCYISAEEKKIAVNHPAKLRHTGDKAKLVSSNDGFGFTYRGRFTDWSQAAGISFDVTQKAHNALRWLISRQGYRNGDQVYVSWAVSGKEIPDPLQDSYSLSENPSFEKEEKTEEKPQKAQGFDHSLTIGQQFADQFNHYLAGYGNKLEPNEQIVVMGLDSATPGRMGIIYYRELLASEFLARLERWHLEFAWPQRHTKELDDPKGKKKKIHKVIWPVSSPVPRVIAEAAYGDVLKSNDTLKKSVIERILPCIVDGVPFPEDLMRCAVRRASNRNNCEHWEWERNLGVACALFKGYYERHPKETERRKYEMGLDKEKKTRDYLYGRLLAVAERIEEIALNVVGENRPTNAARLMQRFAEHPVSTWRTIELSLQPYMQRLQGSRAGFLTNRKKELDEVISAFSPEDFTSDQQLSGEFLLGYHCQRQELHKKKTDEEPTGDSSDSNDND
jgi:CRISPR-associated protein Csd1